MKMATSDTNISDAIFFEDSDDESYLSYSDDPLSYSESYRGDNSPNSLNSNSGT